MKNLREDLEKLDAKVYATFNKLFEKSDHFDFTDQFNIAANTEEDRLQVIKETDRLYDLTLIDYRNSTTGNVIECHVVYVSEDHGIFCIDIKNHRTHFIGLRDVSNIYDRITIVEDMENILVKPPATSPESEVSNTLKMPAFVFVSLKGVHRDEVKSLNSFLDEQDPALGIVSDKNSLVIGAFCNTEQFLHVAWYLESNHWEWKVSYINL